MILQGGKHEIIGGKAKCKSTAQTSVLLVQQSLAVQDDFYA